MEEEKRKILTKEGVRRQQLRCMKGDLIIGLPALLFVEALLIALTCGAYHIAPELWMLWGGCILLDAFVFVLFLWKLALQNLRGWRYIASGNFFIVEDTLVGVGEDEVMRSRGRRRYYTVDMLYFENYGRIPEDKGTRGYGPCGSTFYLVVLGDEKRTLYTFYSSQLYCYKPEEES